MTKCSHGPCPNERREGSKAVPHDTCSEECDDRNLQEYVDTQIRYRRDAMRREVEEEVVQHLARRIKLWVFDR